MNDTNQTDSVAAFLARGGKVTKCPARPARAKSLRNLSVDAERQAGKGQKPNVLARKGGALVNPFADAERRAEARRLADYAEARAVGFTEAEAREYARA